MDVTTHPFEQLDEATRQQLIDALASDGPDLALLLIELARVALAQEKTKLAHNLFNSALYQEEARGRPGGQLAVESLVGLVETAHNLGDGSAPRWAMRLKAVAPDDKTRKQAERLLKRAVKKLEAQQTASPQGSAPMVGGFPLNLFAPEKAELDFASVGGLSAAKDALERVAILPHRNPESAKRFGIETGGGVLLYGPPGCGKTLLATAAAGEMGVPIIKVKASNLLHPLYGMAERNVEQAFKTARDNAPCVLFIDELDGIAQRRDTDFFHRSLVNVLLVEIDSGRNAGVLLIGATNAIGRIDEAVLRPGRFDKLIEVLPPDAAARTAIWTIQLAKYPMGEDVDIALLVELTGGLTGAAIAEVAKSAAEAVWMQSLRDNVDRTIGTQDLLIALRYSGFVDGALKARIDRLIAEGLLREIEG